MKTTDCIPSNYQLILIDAQEDFLSAPRLFPLRETWLAATERLLSGCREAGVPVTHIWTTVHRDPDDRMPHWISKGLWKCLEGSPGHQPPPSLSPLPGECVLHKTTFSGVTNPSFFDKNQLSKDATLIFAGLYLHACVRTTLLDLYQRGWRSLWVAPDAVASDDPLHASITRQYLGDRGSRFHTVSEILNRIQGRTAPPKTGENPEIPRLSSAGITGRTEICSTEPTRIHYSPTDLTRSLWSLSPATVSSIDEAVTDAVHAQSDWRITTLRQRLEILGLVADKIESERECWVEELIMDVGKPRRMAQGEVQRSLELLKAVRDRLQNFEVENSIREGRIRRRPLGVVAVVTPWNNPLAIPVGKLAPALAYGNGVVWKPAWPATRLAWRLCRSFAGSGTPPGLLGMVGGGDSVAKNLMDHQAIRGITLTGGAEAGLETWVSAARRCLPFQTELGGNNAAIVWEDADLEAAAVAIAEGAFGFAGQRCTANRRVIVHHTCYEEFFKQLVSATQSLAWGLPSHENTWVGPLIHQGAVERVTGIVDRARRDGCRVTVPHQFTSPISIPRPPVTGAFFPPTLIEGAALKSEVVQAETFGPLLVVQRVSHWQEAVDLANGVPQGLAASLFSRDPQRKEHFLDEIDAGILKWNQSTVEAGVDIPFGGWKMSGFGPPEHGEGNLEFYTRRQSIYDESPGK